VWLDRVYLFVCLDAALTDRVSAGICVAPSLWAQQTACVVRTICPQPNFSIFYSQLKGRGEIQECAGPVGMDMAGPDETLGPQRHRESGE